MTESYSEKVATAVREYVKKRWWYLGTGGGTWVPGAQAIRESGLKCEGINLLLSDGEVAGQEVFHVHLHVVPRTANDGFGFKYQAPSFEGAERQQLNKVAEQIKKALW